MKFLVKQQLLKIARKSVECKLEGREYSPDFTELSDEAFEQQGVFVVLIEKGFLRSRAGYLEPYKEIYQAVCENAVNAALYTHKYKRVTKQDLPNTVFEISLISDIRKIPYSNPADLLRKIESSSGYMIKEGINKATFLPNMWRAYSDKNEFMSRLCLEASLSDDAWMRKSLEVYSFKAETFAEDDKKD